MRRTQQAQGPTKELKVIPRTQVLKFRLVIQDRILAARSVYIEKGGGSLETPHGDVYLTKEQFEFLFMEV